MSDGSLLSLRWNNHIAQFKLTLSQLQQKEIYNDATIACEGHFYPVHKFVLATCSDYFASIFERTPCKHPVIVLKDISPKDVIFLLSYMYGGEVSVTQTDLPSLIKAAETLNIKGLAAPDDHPPSPEQSKKSAGDRKSEGGTHRKRRKTDDSPERGHGEGIQVKKEVSDGESEDINKVQDSSRIAVDSASLSAGESPYYETDASYLLNIKPELGENIPMSDSSEQDEAQADVILPSSHPSNSPSINWLSYNQTNIPQGLNNGIASSGSSSGSASIEACPMNPQDPSLQQEEANRSSRGVVIPAQHPCPVCPKRFQSRADVVRHMRTHTGEKPFNCPHCDYRAALKGNLKSHILSRHNQGTSLFAPNLFSTE